MKNLKSLIVFAVACVLILTVGYFSSGDTTSQLAGGGLSLKDLNAKAKEDKIEASSLVLLQANQTTEENLEQAMFIANLKHTRGPIYVGAGTVVGVSTQFGVCAPVVFINGGVNFDTFSLDYKVGSFNRNSIQPVGIDPQFDNKTTILGKSANITNAMQLSILKGQTVVGVGHYGGNEVSDLQKGCWYVCAESPLTSWLSLGGGINWGEQISGYASAGVTFSGNKITLNGNKLGTEGQNFIASYNRNLGKAEVTASYFAQSKEQGFHLDVNFPKKWGKLFTETGLSILDKSAIPYFGLGTCLSF